MANELVLIVEDNDKNRKLARDVLQVKGYQTMDTDNAEDGIRLAQERGPALILMDLHLPGIDGIEALERLRSDPRTKSVPVIAVTASAMTEDNEKIIAAGFDGLQTKPIHVKEFLRVVADTIARIPVKLA
jgi:two-component system, cell cycle response regulator DivK